MAKIFQISQGDVGFSYNGANYTFSDADNIAYTYSKKNHITRGASGQNKVGISYKEGLKTPDMMEALIVDCTVAIQKLLLSLFESGERVNAWFIDRTTGEGLTFANAVIRDKPAQGTIGESEDTISFMFAVESFDVKPKIND